MQYDNELVEFVVQEVIRRLTVGGATVTAPQDKGAGDVEPRELVLNERLVTLATLSGRLNGVGRVVVARRAVVSPAAHDELRSQSIALRREE